jgi:ribonuclease HI
MSSDPFPDKNMSLFSAHKQTPKHHLVAFTDGGSRGNPGPAGYGVVIQDESKRKIATLSDYLGHQTNNFAEYQGLIAALEYAINNGHKALKIISDSELLVQQIKGIYKVKNPTLQDLHGRAKELISKLDWFSIEHVLRGRNQQADRLANAAMDEGMGRRTTSVARAPSPAISSKPADHDKQEFTGIVRDGRIELLNGMLPEGTQVQVRVKNR